MKLQTITPYLPDGSSAAQEVAILCKAVSSTVGPKSQPCVEVTRWPDMTTAKVSETLAQIVAG